MMKTLLNELSEIENSNISLTRDSRLQLIESNAKQYIVETSIEERLPEFINKSEVSWLIAPETDGDLTKYAELFIKHGKIFIGCDPSAITVAASKYLTIKKLTEAGVNVVETKLLSETLPESDAGWVIKPDDGVGAENTCIINNKNDLYAFIKKEADRNFIVQPYVEGKHMSMSLLVFDNDVQLLACNKQYVEVNNGSIKLIAIGVNECLSFKEDMLNLAKRIVSAISGFAGYIGVDLIEKENELYVLEINPRFTTAYAGISESLGCNVTSKILNTFLNKKIADIKLDSAKPVRINIIA